MLGITKFGDIIIWDKRNKKFIVVRNYYKLPNALKTNNFEICCMSLGNGLFVSLNELVNGYIWYEAMRVAKVYSGSAPIKSYLPSSDELKSFYPFIKEFNRKIEKLKSLGIECDEIKFGWYWSSTKYDSNTAYGLNMHIGSSANCYDNIFNLYVRAFVSF